MHIVALSHSIRYVGKEDRASTTLLPHIINFNSSVTTASRLFFEIVSLLDYDLARHTIIWSSAIVMSAVPLENSSPLEPELQSFTRSTGVSLRLHDIDYIEFVASGVVDFVVWSTTVGSFSFNENNYPVEFFVVSKSNTFTAQPPTSAFLTGTAAE